MSVETIAAGARIVPAPVQERRDGWRRAFAVASRRPRLMLAISNLVSTEHRSHRPRARLLLLGLLTVLPALVPLVGTTPATPPAHGTAGPARYAASLDYNRHGVPHIRAADVAGLGYGMGYAQATDGLCVLADGYLTAQGQRSLYFGADADYQLGGTETARLRVNNLASDLYFAQLIETREVERLLAMPAPRGPSAEAREMVRGFVAGYNRRVRDIDVDRIGDPACRGAEWVRPIDEMTMWRYLLQVSTLASGVTFTNELAAAKPPSGPVPAPSAPTQAEIAELDAALDRSATGSNAIAVGSRGTARGDAVLIANPHFPWQGRLRFWEARLTMPGMDVSGATLFGIPAIAIGHNRGVAWSHTVSTGRRFTPYQLTLAPDSPTTYLVDGRPEEMTSRTLSVEVRQPDGTTTTVERTLWSSRYGPIVTGVAGLPLPWTQKQAFAVRDAGAGNLRYVDVWLGFARAHDTGGLLTVLRRTQGVPWVNTVAADHRGRTLHADISVVPHVTDELAARCNTPTGNAIFPATGLPLLDGARSECAWGEDPDAVQPGTFGPSRLPVQERRDYLLNSNNSPWLSNAAAPYTGHERIVGDTAGQLSLRARMAHLAVAERLAGTDGLPGRGFDLRTAQRMVLSNEGLAARLVADETVDMCRDLATDHDVAQACDVLDDWDRRYDVDSEGAVLFTRFWQRVLTVAGGPYRVPFDPGEPLTTPRGLDVADPQVRRALVEAVAQLEMSDTPLDAAPGDLARFGGIGLHGGPETDGILNKVNVALDPVTGQGEISGGSAFIQVTAFVGGCPLARTVMTYSQSPDPSSRHHLDQTRLFAEKRWVRERFCRARAVAGPDALRISETRTD